MIGALTGVISAAALTQFVYYCRSALNAAKSAELSEHVLAVAGLESGRLAPGDFERFFELVQLCPEQHMDGAWIRAVAIYYSVLCVLTRTSRELIPAVSSWAEQEQQACSHFAAVVLDLRISSSRDLFLQHAVNRL